MSGIAPALDPASFDPIRTGHFRFRRLVGKNLITNDYGRHRLLSNAEFRDFIAGTLDEGSPLYGELARDGFIRDRMDLDALTAVWRKRNRFLWQGPNLHVVVVTLRCNHRCLYCQASAGSMKDVSTDMSLETAAKVVDRIFESPSPSLTIEFQGGEPLANWPAVKFIIEYAQKKNLEAGKSLWLSLVTNLSLMDDAKLKFLLQNQVSLCTSLDGPADLHDKNRLFAGGSSHEKVVGWFKKISAKTRKKTFRIEALLTVTRYSLPHPKAIIDEYAGLGSRGVFLRSLSPLGLAQELWGRIGYTAEEFLDFYRRAFDDILAINKKKLFVEQTARIFLAKILTDVDPNFLDVRSPCGAGVGQIAYNYDGGVYTCDEGRMFARMGDESFRIGSVREGTYRKTVSHPAVKALSVASLLDTQPDCSRCAYKPYCGVCPIQCYAEQGDIMGRMPTNTRCRIHKGIMDLLFEKLQDKGNEKIFRQWVRRKEEASTYQRL